jgi:hypothetical protein
LFDLFVELADVGGGNGGVATGFGLGFLVSASIGGVDKSGVVVAVVFSKAFGFVKGSPLDDFVIVFGHVAVGIVGVAPILIVGVGIWPCNTLWGMRAGLRWGVVIIIANIRFVDDVAVDIVLVTGGVVIIHTCNTTCSVGLG